MSKRIPTTKLEKMSPFKNFFFPSLSVDSILMLITVGSFRLSEEDNKPQWLDSTMNQKVRVYFAFVLWVVDSKFELIVTLIDTNHEKNRVVECSSLSLSFHFFHCRRFLLFALQLTAENRLCEMTEKERKELLSNSVTECINLLAHEVNNVRKEQNVYLFFCFFSRSFFHFLGYYK